MLSGYEAMGIHTIFDILLPRNSAITSVYLLAMKYPSNLFGMLGQTGQDRMDDREHTRGGNKNDPQNQGSHRVHCNGRVSTL